MSLDIMSDDQGASRQTFLKIVRHVRRDRRISGSLDMTVASHLNCNMPKYQRSLISQLRLGVLPLRIETGRFTGLDVVDRLCQVCAGNHVENEIHFLFECSEYNEYRNELETAINATFSELSIQEKFDKVFSHPHSLSRYVTLAYKKRQEKMYKAV